jgi:hypothetical protein
MLQSKLFVLSRLGGSEALLVPYLSKMHFKSAVSQKELTAAPLETDAVGGRS